MVSKQANSAFSMTKNFFFMGAVEVALASNHLAGILGKYPFNIQFFKMF